MKMERKMETIYIINEWTNGASLVYRTEYRWDWLKKIKEIITKCKKRNLQYRTIERDGVVVFSYIYNASPTHVFAWKDAKILDGKNVEYKLPRELRGII